MFLLFCSLIKIEMIFLLYLRASGLSLDLNLLEVHCIFVNYFYPTKKVVQSADCIDIGTIVKRCDCPKILE